MRRPDATGSCSCATGTSSPTTPTRTSSPTQAQRTPMPPSWCWLKGTRHEPRTHLEHRQACADSTTPRPPHARDAHRAARGTHVAAAVHVRGFASATHGTNLRHDRAAHHGAVPPDLDVPHHFHPHAARTPVGHA